MRVKAAMMSSSSRPLGSCHRDMNASFDVYDAHVCGAEGVAARPRPFFAAAVRDGRVV